MKPFTLYQGTHVKYVLGINMNFDDYLYDIDDIETYFYEGLECYDMENYSKSITIFLKLAEMGYARGEYYLGRSLLKGQGISPCLEEAAKWFRKSAKQGYAEAQYSLGNMYFLEGV